MKVIRLKGKVGRIMVSELDGMNEERIKYYVDLYETGDAIATRHFQRAALVVVAI